MMRQKISIHDAGRWTIGKSANLRFVAFYRRMRPLQASRAFSLVEILVAVSVLVLMLVLVAQIAQMTLQTSQATTARMEGTEAARKILDSLDRDLGLSASGPRLDFVNSELSVLGRITANGTPELAFLTTGRGPSGATPPRFLAVAYSMINDVVARTYVPVGWNATNLMQASASAAASPPLAGSERSELTGGVLQFAVVLLLEDGSIASLAAMEGPILPTPLPAWGKRVVLPGLGQWTLLQPLRSPAPLPLSPATARVASLLVALATIDERSYRLIDPAALPLFPAPTTSDPSKEWESELTSLTLPNPVRSAIRFHSMAIPLP